MSDAWLVGLAASVAYMLYKQDNPIAMSIQSVKDELEGDDSAQLQMVSAAKTDNSVGPLCSDDFSETADPELVKAACRDLRTMLDDVSAFNLRTSHNKAPLMSSAYSELPVN